MQRIIFMLSASNIYFCCLGFRIVTRLYFAWIFAEEGNSWDLISENDLWEGDDSEEEDYVLVRQDDIVDGIACFMAAYLLSLKKTKVCIVIFIFIMLEAPPFWEFNVVYGRFVV
jgi:hypothetical protein